MRFPNRGTTPRWTCATVEATLLLYFLASCAIGLAADAGSPQDNARPRPQIGDKVAAMTFKDIRYLPRSLEDLTSKLDVVPKCAFVLVFTNTTCPLVQKYLPRLKDLDQQYRKRGVQFVAVNVGTHDPIVEMAAQAVKYEAEFPFVKDVDGSCVRACGVERIPEAVLIDAQHRLRYRGRIDNQYRLGGTAPSATQTDLQDAIEDLLAGRDIEMPETSVDGCRITLATKPEASASISFVDVAPLFAKHCQACHQPGTSAPFPLMTYEEVATNAAMIAEVVAERRMPPWYASAEFGSFTNCRVLPDKDRELILAWVQSGAQRTARTPTDAASAKQTPAPVEPPRKLADSSPEPTWLMGEPDLVLTNSATYQVPASGYVDYKYAFLHYIFWQETWIEGAEILPDNPRVLHHCNMGYVSAGGGLRNARLITGYVPGGGPLELKNGVAIKIPARSIVGLQIHLTTTGKPETCRLRVGFRYAKAPVQKQLRYLELSNETFTIPPFASFHPVSRSRTIDRDITATGLFAHMHVRGKDITFRAYPPHGDPETLLMVPNYNFDWQMPYLLPTGEKKYVAGTRFECLAHFDNSTFNPYNPDPTATVHVGEQTVNEMMFGFVFYTDDAEALNLRVDPDTGRVITD